MVPASDANCIHMVEMGIVQKLLALLERHVIDGNVAVQHAALSAVRNLAIPGERPLHRANTARLADLPAKSLPLSAD